MTDVAELARRLVQARNDIADAFAATGVDADRTKTLPELAAEADKLVAPHGELADYTTATTATIYPGDHVALTHELISTDAELRLAIGAQLLDALVLPDGRMVVLMYQAEDVKIKAAKYSGGQLVLGATLVIEDADDEARLCRLGESAVAVIYPLDDMGMAVRVDYTDLVPTLGTADAWIAADIRNIACAYITPTDIGCPMVAYQVEGETDVQIARIYVSSTDASLSSSCRISAEADDDEYTASISAAAMPDGRLAVSWFSAHDRPVGLAIVSHMPGNYATAVDWQGRCVYNGSCSRTSLAALRDGLLNANAVTRVQDGLAVKSFAATEWWATEGTAYGARPRWYAKGGEVVYNGAPACIRAAAISDNHAVMTMHLDGTLIAAIVTPGAAVDRISPLTPLGDTDGDTIPLSIPGHVAMATERDGGVWLGIYKQREVVVPSYDGNSIGIAMRAAAPGSVCKVSLAGNTT